MFGLPSWAWKAIPAALAVAAIVAAVLYVQGLESKVTSLTVARDDARAAARAWEGHARGWQANAAEEHRIRREERREALTSVNDANKACELRVAEARRATTEIRSLTRKEPSYDPQGCPVRGLLPSNQLRNALQPAAR